MTRILKCNKKTLQFCDGNYGLIFHKTRSYIWLEMWRGSPTINARQCRKAAKWLNERADEMEKSP